MDRQRFSPLRYRPNSLEGRGSLNVNEKLRADTKTHLLEAVRLFLEMELAKDPNFKFTTGKLDLFIKKNPEAFLNIRTNQGVLRYFHNNFESLKISLGLADIK